MSQLSNRRASLQQAALAVPPALKQKWMAAFNEFDIQKNNVISAQELAQVMVSKLNMVPQAGEVEAMIESVDMDRDNAVNYEEFEMMMVAAGRGVNGGHTQMGFSHIVERFIRMSEVARLITTECVGFVDRFCDTHREKFAGLTTWDVNAIEQQPAWYDTWRQFTEEGELMMQNLLILWGAGSMRNFDTEFLEEMSRSGILEQFLKFQEYPYFIQKMYSVLAQPGSGQAPGMTPRPETPMQNACVQERVAYLDRQLAMLDYQRNQLLAERRRLVGCEVDAVTTGALKQQLEMLRYREDVGLD